MLLRFLTACLSNFVAAILVITIVFLLSKTGTQELVGELAAEAEAWLGSDRTP